MKKIFFIFIILIIILLIVKSFSNIGTSKMPKKLATDQAVGEIPPGKFKLLDGSIIKIPEFIIQNEKKIKTPSSVFRDIAGNYESNYLISYLPYDKEISQIEFNIILNTNPISKTRLEAENILRTKLGLNNQELCKMDVSVYVFGWVNEKYAGQNLGLSFCDNTIPLP